MTFEEEFPSLYNGKIEVITVIELPLQDGRLVSGDLIGVFDVRKFCLDKQRVKELYITKALVKEVLNSLLFGDKWADKEFAYQELGLEDE